MCSPKQPVYGACCTTSEESDYGANEKLIALGCLLLHDKNRIGLHQMSPFVPDPLK